MSEMFYLGNVILALLDGVTAARFLPLIEKLLKKGISVEAYLADEKLPEPDNALYITDCNKTANQLLGKGRPVLGFWHDNGENLAGIDYIMEEPEEIDARYLERIFRRHFDIPWDIVETERCIIRETTVEDVDAFYKIYEHPDIVRYTEPLYSEKKQEENYIREYINKVYRYFEFGVWTILWKETGEIIGRAGFSVREGYELPDLGYVIGVPWQGKGIAYEICNALLQYAKEEYEFEHVQVLVAPENTASLALCRKLGFVEKERVTEQGQEYIWMMKELSGI